MTNPPYLIAHKVHGQPAFDIAVQMECPECRGGTRDAVSSQCTECDSTGFWWIIPTSGHRAYPYAECDLQSIFEDCGIANWPGAMPSDLPDHYIATAAPSPALTADAIIRLLAKPKQPAMPSPPILRRL